jgi:hypothetical protein
MNCLRYAARQCALVLFVFFAAFPMWSDDAAGGEAGQETAGASEPLEKLIGKTLGDLIAEYGVPSAVFAARGAEEWQDDVVFVYKDFDCYIFEDRVWQVRTDAAYGVKIGDSRAAVKNALGDGARDAGVCMLLRLPSTVWEMTVRVNFDKADKAESVFIYRSDL